MADITISNLPAKTGTVLDTGYLHLAEAGVDKKMTIAQMILKQSEEYSTDINTFLGSTNKTVARANLDIDRIALVNNVDYTILSTDKVVAQTGTISAPRTFSLPSASSFPAGGELIVMDESGTVDDTNNITIQRAGADTIGGNASKVIIIPYGIISFICNGTDSWNIKTLNISNSDSYVDLEVSKNLVIKSTGTNTITISPFRARSKNGNTIISETATVTLITNAQFTGVNSNANYTTSQSASVFYYIFVFTNGTDNKYLVDTVLVGTNAVARLTALGLTEYITDFRRIGTFYSNGSSQVTSFVQNASYLRFNNPIEDVNDTGRTFNGDSGILSGVITVPAFQCLCQFSLYAKHSSEVSTNIRDSLQDIPVPAHTTTQDFHFGDTDGAENTTEIQRMSFNRNIYWRFFSGNITLQTFFINTIGWQDDFSDIPTI